LFYPFGGSSSDPEVVSYSKLYAEANKNIPKLSGLTGFEPGKPVLLHLEDQQDTILWFWTVLLANGIPVLSPPFSNVEAQRRKHLQGLSELLDSPVCITRAASMSSFEGMSHTLQLQTIESLSADTSRNMGTELPLQNPPSVPAEAPESNGTIHTLLADPNQLPILLLTSGTSGAAKAVRLTHQQIFAAVSGKTSLRPLPTSGAFLNWIGLDHVAGLIEIHIQALWLGINQVHVHAADLMASPRVFLDLLSRHQVSRSFAPNFFLAKLTAECSANGANLPPNTWDLRNLTVVTSGGEANDVLTCVAVSKLLERYGAAHNVIVVGFGMTETCAGAIYNTECPDYDVANGHIIASLGRCMPGIEMRVMVDAARKIAAPTETGELQLRGAVVFDGYYNNPTATATAFTDDGWFRTGDQAFLDAKGNLHLVGRVKDVININGVKIPTADVQASVEAAVRNTCVSRIVCFPSRRSGAASEQATVAYAPKTWPTSAEDLVEADRLVVQACMMVSTACRPLVFSVTEESLPFLPISTLGKISTSKMRALVETGMFGRDIANHRRVVTEHNQRIAQSLEGTELTEAESLLRLDIAKTLAVEDVASLSVDAPLYEMGFTSMDLIRLKVLINTRLNTTSVDIVLLLKHPTMRSLAAALDKLGSSHAPSHNLDASADAIMIVNGNEATKPEATQTDYDPVVILRSTGSKTPLWLIHPGIGEILVFVGLAKHMSDDDRPIYALRARGLEPGQRNFTSIKEIVSTYVPAVRRQQPDGPYALAGYSYGAMLAFEMAKELEKVAGEDIVRFLGSFNLPPHIRARMRQLEWNMCLLHLAQFLGLVTEEFADGESLSDDSSYRRASREEAFKTIVSMAGEERMQELSMTPLDLARWTSVAYALPSVALEYDPSGSVQTLDVFHAEPLKILRVSRQQWVDERLSQWRDFCQTEPRFHEVGGTHYSMLGPDHVVAFSKKLKAALKARGL
jgi:acyl-CoA synthetase (AMP-forming)/AMP-acid ligase II/thioesterase domain-containing protein